MRRQKKAQLVYCESDFLPNRYLPGQLAWTGLESSRLSRSRRPTALAGCLGDPGSRIDDFRSRIMAVYPIQSKSEKRRIANQNDRRVGSRRSSAPASKHTHMTDIGRAREAVAEATRTTPRTGVRAASHGRAIGPRLPGPADAPSTCMRDDRPPRRHNTPPLLCMRDDRPPPHPALCALVHAR